MAFGGERISRGNTSRVTSLISHKVRIPSLHSPAKTQPFVMSSSAYITQAMLFDVTTQICLSEGSEGSWILLLRH